VIAHRLRNLRNADRSYVVDRAGSSMPALTSS
jgi:hypothetical protein